MIEILYKGIVHYRRPSWNHPTVKDALQVIKKQGKDTLYSVRESK